ncbi:MAG: alpha-2-macroglobulin family protein [Cytophagales bacterium]|nr:MAG: alpha-2-macroglobulin family protein [Cytophagales bacterium]TAF60160.1 MAG: alpha-2-macroglobulin family protein [Cytophagales bacterium]
MKDFFRVDFKSPRKLWAVGGLCAALILVFTACWDRSIVKVNERNFQEEIQPKQNLTFTFNKSLVAPEDLQKWSDEALVRLTPKVEGKFKWTTQNTLVFSPDKGFDPSTDYTAELTPKLLDKVKEEKLKLDEEKTFKFHTPYLGLSDGEAYWTADASNSAKLVLNLNFNYSVNPADFNRLAKLSVDGTNLTYAVVTNEASESIRLNVSTKDPITLSNKKVVVNIEEGLPTALSATAKAKSITYEMDLPPADRFEITQASSERFEDKAFVRVFTNQSVSMNAEQIKALVSFEPAISFEIETADFGFLINANFETGQNYKMVINRALKGVFGKNLNADFEHFVVFGNVQSLISFADQKALYLTNQGEQNVAVKIFGLKSVNVKVYKIYENNLMHFMRQSVGLYDYSEFPKYFYEDLNNFGDVVYDQTSDLREMFTDGGEGYILNMKKIKALDTRAFNGFYLLQVGSDDDRWIKDYKIVSVSDLGFIVKRTEDEVHVFVNSIHRATPVAGAQVKLISYSNQETAVAQTDAAGVAVFKDLNQAQMSMAAISAIKGGDYNFMHFGQNPVNKSEFELSGYDEAQGGYQTFVYAERDLYRPGETINFKSIVRNYRWGVVADMPVRVEAKLPNGSSFFNSKANLNSEGTFEMSIPTSENSVTGSYTIDVMMANGTLLASKSINIEEFMPQRIKVTPLVESTLISHTKPLVLNGTAVNLFGPPAADRRYEITLQVQRKDFTPVAEAKKLTEYYFGVTSNGQTEVQLDDQVRTGNTDEQGKFTETFSLPAEMEKKGFYEAKLYSTVFDETGRSVSRSLTVGVHTQDVFFGLKPLESYYVDVNAQMRLPIVAVNPAGQVLSSAKARVDVFRYDYQNVLERNDGDNYRYVSQRKEYLEASFDLNVGGMSSAVGFVPKKPGYHEVRVSVQGAKGYYVAQGFYSYSYGGATASSFDIDKDGRVGISFDRPKYEVGETAKVLFKTPFSGRMLVTIERNKIFEYKYLEVASNSAVLDIPITDVHLPNLYVTATLIKPQTYNTPVPLTVAHGFEYAMVSSSKHSIPLTIKTVEKSRSKQRQTITVEASGPSRAGAELTISVVDEGILQIRDYETPDPLAFYFQKRALQVDAYDLYPRLFPEIKARRQTYGADGYDLDKRTNPFTNKRVKPVRFWSGTLKTDANGKATFDIDVPEFSGELRVMALAVKGSSFGSAETRMKVADPMVISAGLPRFVSPQDRINVPVTLTNTTNTATEAVVNFQTGNNLLKTLGGTEQTVTIPANSEKLVIFEAEAAAAVGETNVLVTVKAVGETFTSKTDLTVRPSTSLLKQSGSGEVLPNNAQNVSLAHKFLPFSASAKLIVGKTPMVQFAKNLNYLIQYPHGCAEQTISTAFPQLYLADLSKSFGRTIDPRFDPNFNIKEAITKLQTMQSSSGGLVYWQGGSDENPWATVYGTHFLIEARKLGFEVNERFYRALLENISSNVKNKRTEFYFYRDASNKLLKRRIAPKDIFYGLYVLATAGKQQVPTMNYYKQNAHLLAKDSKYLLALTYKMLGDDKSYRLLLPTSFDDEKSENASDGSFYSYIRDEALALNALLENDPNNAQIPLMAKHLSQALSSEPYLNTQENVFGILALGKLAKKSNAENVTGTVEVDGQNIANFNGETLILDKNLVGKNVTLKTTSGGKLYYFWEVEGISATGAYVEEDKFLRVRREFYDRNGNKLNTRNFKQGDLLVIKISLNSVRGNSVPNVVITDMLPSGFEVENPRLSDTQGIAWAKDAQRPDHFDFRDDRVNIFATAAAASKSYYYVVRAVNKGTFQQGPVSADAMYDGEYHSYHGSGVITIN